jgi:hypothetical protein
MDYFQRYKDMQHHLVLTVATTFAVGFTAGALIGWTMRQN